MKNWKTTIAGTIAATGMSLQVSPDAKTKVIGVIIGAIGTFLFGLFSKDNNVTGGTVKQ